MPTPPKPVDLQTGHISNEEREAKKESEITLGVIKYTAPDYVKNNTEANKKWNEITNLYKRAGIQFVSSSDNGVMGRYCVIYSEYIDLVERRRILSNLEFPEDLGIVEKELTEVDRFRTERLFTLMDYLVATKGILELDKAINAKCKTLLDLENTLFLNPLAKIRAVPVQKKPKKQDEAKSAGFDV